MSEEIRKKLEELIIEIQSGKFGIPTFEILQICGKIHAILGGE